jgi:hypothetical protein
MQQVGKMQNRFDFEHKPAYSITMLTIIIASIVSVLGVIIIPDIYITVSFIIGIFASIIGFLLSVFRSDLIFQEGASRPALITMIGFTINYVIYGIALYLSLKIDVLNIFATLAGLLLMKAIIYIKYGFINLKKDSKKIFDKEGDNIE